MADGLRIKVDASKLIKRLTAYKNNIQAQMEASWPQIIDLCVADVLTRTPPPEVEYAFIMGIQGGSGYGSNGGVTDGKRSRTPADDNRVQFVRDPGLWLQQAVANPATYTSKTGRGVFTIGLGNAIVLEELTRFSWINASRNETYPHTSEYGLWSFFEFGTEHIVGPCGWGGIHANGLAYKLRPSDYEAYWAMLKRYPKMSMYTGFNRQVFYDAVASKIREVQF